jgi:hypothetical protein
MTVSRSTDRAQEAYRALGRASAAGVITGVLVGGIGGRIVMRVSAIAADSDGLITEGGNRVGDITVGGTIALVVFGGVFSGVFGVFGLLAVRPWLPHSLPLRALLLAVIFPLMIGATVISSENPDFVVLDPPELNFAMFVGLFVAFGAVVAVAEELVDRWLPPSRPTDGDGGERVVAALVLMVPVLLVSLLLLVDGSTYLVGPFFLLMGIATVWRMVGPLGGVIPSQLDRLVTPLGYGSLFGACVAGSWHLAQEYGSIT